MIGPTVVPANSRIKSHPFPRVLLAFLSCIPAFAQSYTISTFAGGGAPVNIPGTSAGLGSTPAVALDAQGNVYFANDCTVLRLDAQTGILSLVAGNGTYGYSGDNGPAVNAQLFSPYGVAVDTAGNVYIADLQTHRVRKVSNGIITTVAGNGLAGYGGDNGPATDAELNSPWGIAVDNAGNLYIADVLNERIREVTNGTITTVAGSGVSGSGGDNGPATAAAFNGPIAVAVDSSHNLYIADAGNESIRKVSNGIVTTVAGNGTQGFSGDNGPATSGQLNEPQGVAVDSAGNLYIADTQNSLVRRVAGGVITTLAGNRTAGFSGDGGPAASAELNNPSGVAVSPAGIVYIADNINARIRTVSNGIIATVAGNGQSFLFSGDGGPASSAQLFHPTGLVLDSAEDLYIADTGNQRIRKVSAGVITTVAGTGVAGASGNNGPPLSAQLNGPSAVALDSAGNLYIADSQNNRIQMVSNGVMSTIAGTGFAGVAPDTVDGDGGPATAAYLNQPTGIALDSAGSLYIVDSGHYRVRKVTNGVITNVAGTGLAGFSGDNGPATSAQSEPQAITFDSAGNLYIADGDRVRMVSNGIITTVAGNGSPGFSGDNGPATAATLNSPLGVAVDPAGNLYIADFGGYRVRKVTNGVITTIAGNGTVGFSGDGGPAIGAQISPDGIGVDNAGNVYVSDPPNQRIRLLTPGPTVVTPPPPSIQAVVNAVDYSTMLVPGSWVAIFGSNLSPSVNSLTSLPLQNQLSGVSVTMSGTPLALRYVSPGQINALLPFGPPGDFQFVVSTPTGTSTQYQAALNTVGPSVYTANESGTGAALVFDSGFNPVTQLGADPVVLYASGLGPTNPVGNAAAGGSTTEPFNRVTSTVTVQMGGQPAQVLFAGLAPGLPGVYQLNVVPPDATMADDSLLLTVTPPSDGASSGATTLPIVFSANTTNLSGSIDMLYPVNGSDLGFSALLTAATFNTAFDILPGAQPFTVAATCAAGTANISFNPAAGTWQATLTVPTVPARSYNFSAFTNPNGSALLVTDFTTGQPFPGEIVPESRIDPIAAQAIAGLPQPNSGGSGLNATYVAQGTIPANGHVVIGGSGLSGLSQFGGFLIAPSPSGDAITRRSGCTLIVDGMLVSSAISAFN